MTDNAPANTLPRWLSWIERTGNRLPHPTLLFVWLCILLWPLSALLEALSWQGLHPATGEPLVVTSLASAEGLNFQITHLVSNFTGFAPLGIVLVAMLGIGIAERSGLLRHLLEGLARRTPDALLIPVVAFAGIMSSMAADAGYVVLIPLAGLLFQQAGKSPLLGIAVAFAGVSGGFSANLLVGPVDAMLSGLTTEAAQLVDPVREVSATSNYWFMLASTLFITIIITLVASAIAPGQAPPDTQAGTIPQTSPLQSKALKAATIALAGCLLLMFLAASEHTGVLRQPGQSLASSDFIRHIVVLVAFTFAVCGYAYGRVSGQFRNASAVIEAMEQTMSLMAGYLVLMFFAAQFVAGFNWTGIGSVMAIKGASWLAETGLSGAALLVAAVVMAAVINLLVGSASAKWAVLAPVIVPMLMLLGISPEATQAAFRVGDSSTNIITPLMPYFALVLGFARQYQPDAGIGTLAALMLPFSLALLAGWTVLLAIWVGAGWPLGF